MKVVMSEALSTRGEELPERTRTEINLFLAARQIEQAEAAYLSAAQAEGQSRRTSVQIARACLAKALICIQHADDGMHAVSVIKTAAEVAAELGIDPPDDRILWRWSDQLQAIQAAPPTCIPLLLRELIEIGYARGAFEPGGASRVAAGVEAVLGAAAPAEPERSA